MSDEQRTPLQRYDIEPGWDGAESPDPDGAYLRVEDLASEEVVALRWKGSSEYRYELESEAFELAVRVGDGEDPFLSVGEWGWIFNNSDDLDDSRSGFSTSEAAMSDAEQWLVRQCGAFILGAIKGREIIEGE